MNHLKNEKSPYLLQHAENPVDWYPWCAAAFEKAMKEDKPVFLSIGYSTCHWCHVMAHESFEDEEVAAVLNRDYVCVKVDREERPDIDAVYMTVCQAMNGSGGWPLTIIMTPDQKPFFAATYLPKKQRFGYAGLLDVLEKVTAVWKYNRIEALELGRRIQAYLQEEQKPADKNAPDEPDKTLLHGAVQLFVRQFDARWGGFGPAPKFPIPHNLLYLMRYAALEHQPWAMKMAEDTLQVMAAGGIHDQIGGGFSRYSTDEKWLVPHFEKMLYDNALLAMAYLQAFHLTGKTVYEDTARRTLDYVLRELTGPDGEFFCGQDADSEGVEGKYYVFTPEEICRVLEPEDGQEFCRLYDITEKGNFEGCSIPNRLGSGLMDNAEFPFAQPWPAEDVRLRKLYEYRLKRTALHRDDKVILSWNGWMTMAFAMAARILGEERYRQAAVSNVQFVRAQMTDENGRLYHRWRDGDAAHAGQLDDYAVWGLALFEVYQLTQNPSDLKEAVLYAGKLTELFEDRENGGFFMTASDAEMLIARPKETYDGAVPCGNSAAAVLLEEIAACTGDLQFRDEADRQIYFLSEIVGAYPSGCSMSLIALTQALYPWKMLICASAGEGLPEELTAFLRQHELCNVTILLKTAGNSRELAEVLPFTAEYPIPENGAVYYLCKEGRCMAPETELEKLKNLLLC
ncbi:MAG: thioredoxin domain-containing protein [Lachnospiraceae bacterium]|nr:thioredoxin domain-containing protein [Lachnospiraceae bacterium]